MDELYRTAAEIIKNSKNCIALTGAGISVESGIPDFRSAGGLWDIYDINEYAHIDSFRRNPAKVWDMLFALHELVSAAKPNSAHLALAKLEKMNLLKSIITQNIDNLHQAAGSVNVIEFHGNGSKLQCLTCSAVYPADSFGMGKGKPPECPTCKRILKPTVIFFGEMIPYEALLMSEELALSADAIMVIGTSAVVYPASGIPHIAKQRGAKVIEMNREHTGLTGSITDLFLQGMLGETLPKLLKYIEGK